MPTTPTKSEVSNSQFFVVQEQQLKLGIHETTQTFKVCGKKSHTQETLNFLNDADSSTNSKTDKMETKGHYFVFTELASLGQFSHRVAMSGRLDVCSIRCSFFRPLIGPQIT